MKVVDGKHDRRLRGEVVDHPVEPVQHRERAVERRPRQRGGGRGKQRRGQRGGACEQPPAVRVAREHGLEQLADTAVGKVALKLARARPQTREAVLGGHVERRAQQARLPEPRDALDEHDPPKALPRDAKCATKHLELALALEKRLAHSLRIWSGAAEGPSVPAALLTPA